MKERIETQDLYSIEDCQANPDKYYIFGDNLIHQGCGGQAIIRYCPNAFGIPTKRLPTMDRDGLENPFFSDKPKEIRRVTMRLATLLTFYQSEEKPVLVFPSDGIGTGRAQLKEHSPEIYKLIDDFFKTHFDLHIMP